MGHVWDETLEEYNNPMPKWWSWMFVITVVFALVYLALYPGLGNFKGMLGWTSVGQHKVEVDTMDAKVKPLYDKYMAMDLKAVAADKDAMDMGKRLYLTYCMQCHGADARGAKGFPNLTDADWQWGGQPEQIVETISGGRMGVMPPHAQLGGETIKDLANYVRSLSGLPNDSVRATKGQAAFAEAGCSGCHGAEGTGMQALGAPNLTDKVWLYGSSEAVITETITNGRQNKMPAWKEFLGEAKVHLLSAYVLSLGGK
jgi:cytochrome c oxidase cbb3-type subunit 3